MIKLAAEPVIRRAKAQTNGGFKLLHYHFLLQYTINGLNRTTSILGLRFNAGKYSSHHL